MKQRIGYIDNLRIFLTFLVVAHHWAISNGAPGDTYYVENNLGMLGTLLMSIFVATNQAFFMGFFFFISAYFVPGAYAKKGLWKFFKERLIRLGIPLLFYVMVISPLLIYYAGRLNGTSSGSLWEFVQEGGGRSVGPMWFVLLLLLFSGGYAIFESLAFLRISGVNGRIAAKTKVIGVMLVILVTFLIRIYFPVGAWIPILGIQPAHLIQYIVCFGLGIWAFKSQVLNFVRFDRSKRWFLIAQGLILIGLPSLLWFGGALEDSLPFLGGNTWQSFTFAAWEQLVALSLILGLLGIFERRFNVQPNWMKELSKNSYAIYVFHGIVLLVFSALFQFYEGDSMIKFTFLLFPILLFCTLLARLIRSIPFVDKVL